MFNVFPKWIIDKITVRKYTPRSEVWTRVCLCRKTRRSPRQAAGAGRPMSLLSVFLVGIVTIDTMTHDTSPDCSFEKVSDFSQSKINKQMTEFAFGCLLFQRNLITEEYWKVSISSCRPDSFALCGNEKWNYWIMKLSHNPRCDTLLWCFIIYLLSLIRNCMMCHVQG